MQSTWPQFAFIKLTLACNACTSSSHLWYAINLLCHSSCEALIAHRVTHSHCAFDDLLFAIQSTYTRTHAHTCVWIPWVCHFYQSKRHRQMPAIAIALDFKWKCIQMQLWSSYDYVHVAIRQKVPLQSLTELASFWWENAAVGGRRWRSVCKVNEGACLTFWNFTLKFFLDANSMLSLCVYSFQHQVDFIAHQVPFKMFYSYLNVAL